MTTSVLIPTGSEQAVRVASAALATHGFRVVRSFDWRSAAAGHGRCACPHHGTAHCTCQYVILLAYGPGSSPLSLTAHTYDASTELQIVDDPNAPANTAARSAALAALVEAADGWSKVRAERPHNE